MFEVFNDHPLKRPIIIAWFPSTVSRLFHFWATHTWVVNVGGLLVRSPSNNFQFYKSLNRILLSNPFWRCSVQQSSNCNCFNMCNKWAKLEIYESGKPNFSVPFTTSWISELFNPQMESLNYILMTSLPHKYFKNISWFILVSFFLRIYEFQSCLRS